MYLGDIIKKYREEEQISANEFAKRCDLSRAYIGILEKNKNTSGKKPVPTIEVVMAVAKAMNISPNELFSLLDETQKIDISPANNKIELTKEESNLIKQYNQLSREAQKEVDEFIQFKLNQNK